MYEHLGISVERMLQLDILKDAKILAGAEGVQRRITKVNVMEVPDILNWISEGEFLLTTAYSIKDNIKILNDIIPKMDHRGVAGLGIKIGRYIRELPQSILDLANELKFPIIEIPLTISHTDVISCILREVIEDHMKMIFKIDEFNNQVMDIMMKGGSLKEITAKLYDNIGNSLAIYENIYDSSEVICKEEVFESIKNIVYEDLKKIHIVTDSEYIQTTDRIDNKSIDRITIPIIIEKINYGWIFIWMDNKALTPLDIMLVKSYVHIIALDFVKKLSVFKIESNYKVEFFDDLLSDQDKRRKKALSKAKVFNLDKELKYTVIVILIKDLYDLEKLTVEKVNLVHELISNLLFIVGRITKMQDEKIIFVDKSDRILILFGCSHEKNKEDVKKESIAFSKRILEEMKKKQKKQDILIGIGRTYEEINQVWRSLEQATWIVENIISKGDNGVLHYDDMGIYKILCHSQLQGELIRFCEETLEPLLFYDKDNKSALVETLQMYFECDGNMKKLSQKMYVHYNTIIYRLQKIKDITGINLENCDERLNLQLALKAMGILNKSNK